MNTENNKLIEKNLIGVVFKGTPAPWVSSGHHIYKEDGSVAHAQTYVQSINYAMTEEPDTEGLANAQLMAAAPELLSACQKAYSVFLQLAEQGKYPEMCLAENGGEGLSFIRKAIEKALLVQ